MSPQQLQMIWIPGTPVQEIGSLPAGYVLRSYQPGDDEAYIQLMQSAGFSGWNQENLQRVFNACLAGGIYFIEESKTGALAATACATHSPREFHPTGGELGWVAVDPRQRGLGLSYWVCSEVVRLFLSHGYTDIYLLTDDFRSPAIYVYLRLGWVPYLCAEDMLKRWQAVYSQLGLTFDHNRARKPEGL
jgi:mycothiol synthase